jgi:hypothetical protein
MDNTATLTSLAMLKVNADVAGRDYVDYVVPFIGFVLNRHTPDPVTAAAVPGLLNQEFGLNIPQHPTEDALHRLADQKFLRRESYVYRIAKPIPTADIEARRESLRNQHQSVVDGLRVFASARGEIWSEDETRNALLSYLRRFSIESLRIYTHGSPFPDTPPLDEQALLTVNLFVRSIHETDRVAFESFIALVKGHMLANALARIIHE